MWAQLPEGQVAAEHGDSRIGKSVCKGGEQRRLAIRSRSVRKHKRFRARLCREMEKSANGNAVALFRKWLDFRCNHCAYAVSGAITSYLVITSRHFSGMGIDVFAAWL